jgi:hypothetical protein
MHPNSTVRSYSAAVALIFLLLPVNAVAQVTPGTPTPLEIAPPSRPDRPYRGLFGATVGETTQSLTLEGSFGIAMNAGDTASNAPGGASVIGDDSLGSQRGQLGAGSARLSYQWAADRWGISASNLTTVDYYPKMNRYQMLPREVFEGHVYFMPTKSTRVSVNPHFKDLPEFSVADLFDTEMGQVVPLNADFRLTLDRYQRYGTYVDLGQQLSSRSRLSMNFAWAHGQIPRRQWTQLVFTGRVQQAISKGLGVYVGGMYGQVAETKLGIQQPRESHPRIDVGVDFNKPLSISRRTLLGFSTGIAGAYDRSTDVTHYRLVGGARLSHEFGRTWLSEVIYSRNVRYVESVGEPLFTDSVTFGVQGSFNRRIQFKSYFGKTIARLGFEAGNGFDTLVASTNVSIGLTKMLGIGTHYSYYDYSVLEGSVPSAANGKIYPHRAGVYLQLWVPFLSRAARD